MAASPLLTGQVTLSSTPQPLSLLPIECGAFIIKAPATNVAPMYVGGPTVSVTTGYPLVPGETLEYERNLSSSSNLFTLDPSDFYVVGDGITAGVAAWLASQ